MSVEQKANEIYRKELLKRRIDLIKGSLWMITAMVTPMLICFGGVALLIWLIGSEVGGLIAFFVIMLGGFGFHGCRAERKDLKEAAREAALEGRDSIQEETWGRGVKK